MSAPRLPFGTSRTMSLSAAEFALSIAKLGAHSISVRNNPVFELSEGHVEVHFAPERPKTFGGLLALPQATVTLIFEGASAAARAEFLHRFDIAFQRGGG